VDSQANNIRVRIFGTPGPLSETPPLNNSIIEFTQAIALKRHSDATSHAAVSMN